MIKYALVIGIAAEWLFGPEVHSLDGLLFVVLRTLVAAFAAWMALEALRVPFRAVQTLDPMTQAEHAAHMEAARQAAAQRAADPRRRRRAAAAPPAA
jgi:hypothetical protein